MLRLDSDDGEDIETVELKELLRDAFGESSDDEEAQVEELNDPSCRAGRVTTSGDFLVTNWERINQINGLSLCRDFLSLDQQSQLLSAIHQDGWFSKASVNQAMRFGDLPGWALELSHAIREVIFLSKDSFESKDIKVCDNEEEPDLFPSDILWREPLFDQLIVNKYEPGEGICAHVDLMRFQDGIAIVSLESSCVMHFTPAENEDLGDSSSAKIPLLLTPGSLVLMWGEARYLWKHEINRAPGFQTWEGQEIHQSTEDFTCWGYQLPGALNRRNMDRIKPIPEMPNTIFPV